MRCSLESAIGVSPPTTPMHANHARDTPYPTAVRNKHLPCRCSFMPRLLKMWHDMVTSSSQHNTNDEEQPNEQRSFQVQRERRLLQLHRRRVDTGGGWPHQREP